MEQRQLGKQGLRVSALGLGCMGMSEYYGIADEKESLATLHRALEMGINFFDTADLYGPFINEKFVGDALRSRRDKVIIATKFGFEHDARGQRIGINGRPEYVRKACDDSLRRLGVEIIDLYYQHRVDPDVPIEDTVGAMAGLVRAGKVRYLGLSEAGPKTIRRAHRVHPITALQTEYSLWSREPEAKILPTLRELGIGFVPYSPLGRGFLTGKIKRIEDLAADDFRRSLPRFEGENFQKNLALVDRLTAMAQAKGITAGQLALAWVQAKGKDIVSIPGTTGRKHLEENVAALDVALSASEMANIEAAMPIDAALGGRYAEASMKRVGI